MQFNCINTRDVGDVKDPSDEHWQEESELQLERANSLKIDKLLREDAKRKNPFWCLGRCASSRIARVSSYIKKSLGWSSYKEEGQIPTPRERKASRIMGEPVKEVMQVVRKPKLSFML